MKTNCPTRFWNQVTHDKVPRILEEQGIVLDQVLQSVSCEIIFLSPHVNDRIAAIIGPVLHLKLMGKVEQMVEDQIPELVGEPKSRARHVCCLDAATYLVSLLFGALKPVLA